MMLVLLVVPLEGAQSPPRAELLTPTLTPFAAPRGDSVGLGRPGAD